MFNQGNRTITVQKAKLITQIKENKKNHIEMYEKAVVAYKKEAIEQLATQMKRVEEGELNANLELVTPLNNADNYDSIVQMFEWDIRTEVDLTQNEFKEYVQDENALSEQALFSNTMYSSRF